MEVLSDLNRQKMEAAAMEGLRQQAIAMNSAMGNAEDAVVRDQSLRILSRRRTELDEAFDSYQLAFQRYRRVADKGSCTTALAARRLLLYAWDEAMDELEAHMKVKLQEESAATMELVECGVVEQLAEEDKLVEKFGIKEVEEPRIDKLVVEESANKVELEFFAAEVEVERFDVSEVEDEITCEIRTAEVQAEWMAIKPLEDPGEQAVKSVEEMQVDIEVKQKLGGVFRGKFEVEETRINKDGLEFRATEEELEFSAIRNKLQELRILESNHEDKFGDEFELQVPEFGVLRFLGWVSRSLTLNSEYG